MFIHNIDPVIFSLGPFDIRWYGLVWVITFFFALYFLKKHAERLKVKKDEIESMLVWMIILVVIGARFFPVFVYSPWYYLSNPFEIIAIWKGGLSFHGGLLFATLYGLWWCRKKKINPVMNRRWPKLFTRGASINHPNTPKIADTTMVAIPSSPLSARGDHATRARQKVSTFCIA